MLDDYRGWLVKADHEASQAYDKTLLTLAGGALGVSFAFVKDLAPHPTPDTIPLLIYGWSAFASSLLATLFSMLTSQFALRRAMAQHDHEELEVESPGGAWATATWVLSIGAGILFLIGVALVVWFAGSNLSLVQGQWVV